MKILGIDSTSKNLSICVSSNDNILSSINDMRSLKHMKNIINNIEKVFSVLPFTIRDIELFAVNLGPGDFTGTRIGISVIKTFSMLSKRDALGLNALDVFTVSSLFKNIDRIEKKLSKKEKVFIVPLMDVRNQEIFFSIYEAASLKQENITKGIKHFFKNNQNRNITFISEQHNLLIEKIYDKNILIKKDDFKDDFYQLVKQIKRLKIRTCSSCTGLFIKENPSDCLNDYYNLKKTSKADLKETNASSVNFILTGNAFFSYDSIFTQLKRCASDDRQIKIFIEKNNKNTKAEHVNRLANFQAMTGTKTRAISPFYVRDFVPFGN